jgi:glycine/D-amino acid oxidase-like deaminating enzyme/nitrite reductase/ring-hydroxylating ferredoxin subunit
MEQKKYQRSPLWDASPKNKNYQKLTQDLNVDVVIIGAGITGLTCAKLLSQAGKQVVVLEQRNVGGGTTGYSTGNLYATFGQYLHQMESKQSTEVMQQVVESRKSALDFILRTVVDDKLSCEFRNAPWYLFSSEDGGGNGKVSKEKESISKTKLNWREQIPQGFPVPIDEVVMVLDQAQLNPLQYVQELALKIESSKCQIFENSQVISIEDTENGCIVKTSEATVNSSFVIMATHTPKGIYGVHTSMEVKREYALAVTLKDNYPAPGIYWDVHEESQAKFSIRTCKNQEGEYLLVLHEQHKVGHMEDNFDYPHEIDDYLNKYFEVDEVKYAWSAQQYNPLDKLPSIGWSTPDQHVIIATGFSADGLVFGTLAGMIAHDLILGLENPWQELYNPTRFPTLKSVPKLMKHNFEVLKDLVVDYLTSDVSDLNDIPVGEGKIINLEGEHLAVYKNKNGEVQPMSAICPHMGCTVHWNNFEKSWDCPCHGSRFDISGEIIEGPTLENLKKIDLAN